MAENPAREPACFESCCPGQFGAPIPHAGVTFTALTGLTLIELRGDPANSGFQAAAESALGCKLPQPNRAAIGNEGELLWLGPDAWLVIGNDRRIAESLAIADGSMTDVSHGRGVWRITGPRVLEMLAKGCSLDLHPRVFVPGHCAATSLAHVGVLIHKYGDCSFNLYCARSYAQHVWHWLTEAASEFGYEVLAPL